MDYISIIVFAGVISGIGLLAYHMIQTSKEKVVAWMQLPEFPRRSKDDID